jgi:5'-3' exonuclease
MGKIALVDGDTVAYRCAASCEPNKEKEEREPLELAIRRADELLYRILNTTQTEEHRIFLSGSDNFRKRLYPLYKANRERLVRPAYLEPVREFLIREWGSEVCAGYEADDGIGIAAKENFIICSNDKDFRQIEGELYNFVKDEFEVVDSESAALNFFSHMLIGDTSDNVGGVRGIGRVKARRILDGLDAGEMYHKVLSLFGSEEQFLLVYRLLRILRSEEEYHEIEATISESKGQEPTEVSSAEDPTDVPGVDQE